MTGLFKNKEKQVQRVVLIETSLIIPNRSQPRVTFSDEELSSLADSIRENGILQPINVRKCGVNYEIVSGERRLRAAKLCGFESVPCIIIDVVMRNPLFWRSLKISSVEISAILKRRSQLRNL